MFRSIFYKTGHTGLVFFSTLVLSKLLLPGDFGVIALLLLNSTLFNIVTGFGSESMIMYMVSNQKMKTAEATGYMTRVLGIQVVIFLILEILSSLIFKKTILSWMDPSAYLVWEILYFLGLIITDKILIFFYAHLKSLRINRLLLILSALYIITLGLLFLKEDISLEEIFMVLSLYTLLQGGVLMIYFAKQFPFKFSLGKAAGVNLYLQQSFYIILANIIQLFAYRIDLWILKAYYSNEEVGLFSLATKFANLIWILPNLITQLMLPYFSKVSIEETGKIFRVAIGFNMVITLFTILATYIFYNVFIDPVYQVSLPAFYWMLPGYFCWAGVIYFAGYFAWKGEFKVNLYASIGCFIFIFLLDMMLIPGLSLIGAAIANSIVYSLVLVYYIILFTRRNSIAAAEILRFRFADFHFVKSLLKQ
jgi:O-antigen/teichoic acid export membrane protein